MFQPLILFFITIFFLSGATYAKNKAGETKKSQKAPLTEANTAQFQATTVAAEKMMISIEKGMEKPVSKPIVNAFLTTGLGRVNGLSIVNRHFNTQYAGQIDMLPTMTLTMSKKFWRLRGVEWSGFASAGIGMSSGGLNVKSSLGTSARDLSTLQWIPLMSGLRFDFFGIQKFGLPNIYLGTGLNQFNQEGEFDGMDHTAWKTAAVFGGGLRILRPKEPEASFTGIDLGADYILGANGVRDLSILSLRLGSGVSL